MVVGFTQYAVLFVVVLSVLTGCVRQEFSRPASVRNQVALANCSDVAAGAERAACFNKIADSIAGSWRIAVQTSPIDGSRSIFLSSEASGLTFNQDRQPTRPVLWIRCEENQTSFYVEWNTYLGISEADVSYSVDSASVSDESWILADDRQTAGLWNGADAIPFIKTLFGGEELVMEVTPYGGSALTGRFELTGIEQAIAPMREACGWQ